MKLFRSILDVLFPPRDTERLIEDATLESLGTHARPFVVTEEIVALLPYRTRLVRACVIEAKFKDNEKAQLLLARVLADYLNEWSADHALFDTGPIVLVPVPLSDARLKERGYNQAERIARKAAAMLPDVYLDTTLMERVRDTEAQTSLSSRERRANLANAFKISGTFDPSYTYIVLDDVTTTGATLENALSALRGVRGCRALAIALAH